MMEGQKDIVCNGDSVKKVSAKSECINHEELGNGELLEDLKQKVAMRTKSNILLASEGADELRSILLKSMVKSEEQTETQKYLELLEHLMKIDEYLLAENKKKHNSYLLFKFKELSEDLIRNGGAPTRELLTNMNFFANVLKKLDFQSEEAREKVSQLVSKTKILLENEQVKSI